MRGSGREPTFDAKDVEKLNRVHAALHARNMAAAAKEAKVFELVPLALP